MSVKHNISVKLIGYLFFVSVLPLLLFAIISYGTTQKTIFDLARSYSTQLLFNQRDYLELEAEQVESLAFNLAGVEEISNVVVKADQAATLSRNSYDDLFTQAEIRQRLNANSSLKGVISIDLFTTKGHRFYVGDTLNVAPVNDMIRQTIFDTGIASEKSILWLGVENNLNPASPNRKVLTALKIIRHFSPESMSSTPVGMILINYSTDYLYQHFSHIDMGEGAYLMAVDSYDRMIYHPDKEKIGKVISSEFNAAAIRKTGIHNLRLNGQELMLNSTCLAKLNWCIVAVIPEKTFMLPMERQSQTAAFLILLCLGLIAFGARQFNRAMLIPIKNISDGFRKIEEQPYAQLQPLNIPDRKDEISELVGWFNAFLESLEARKKSDEELRENQEKFSNIFQKSPLPLSLANASSGRFIDVNDAWLNQFGFSREEVIGRSAIGLGLWADDTEKTRLLAQLNEKITINQFEVRYRCKDGRDIICLLSGRVVELHGEQFYIFSPTDITRQREIEREIQEINQELESRVQRRTLNLEQTNTELANAMETLKLTKDELVRSEKMAALGSLVAGVAHELNTPIGNSVTVASTLQHKTQELAREISSGKIRRSTLDAYLDSSFMGTELLMRNLALARDLVISFKQVAVDQASNQRRRFDLKNTLADVVVMLDPMYKNTPFVLEVALQDGIQMDSYPGPLGQLITNFVTNALAHAFEGRNHGTMRLTTKLQQEDMVEITFSDNGVGIPAEHQPRVFDPFFTTKLGQGGSGLGLNIVFNIVTSLLGGKIELQSYAGVGTSLIITLPLKAPDVADKKVRN
ncbi:ATP-binding protein [Undibacterium sp. RTI2.1]|uniref:ATP-binding protein n=1 Tax=unclassified Undibacterium TaxID=2630295 RepID=UPI002AB4F57E|nr:MULTISPECIES: ATP-binding protein [unclassified Undibacterium]MDY7539754.1 ATP-binding protein [Undibacterium sp. 5I1]MEB0030773.1 ATP-binding protein [Undibacterium sp. RTI2.1]MEB0117108.1 ATP-binding protein [Undibacterium sp. RTI2.2]MEB0233089.1 ATP-binding protein [Undibacterium sp. 10I3]MEB0256789.1 ATP-binding protein [Undibacterium sp. 5I1]